MKRKWTEFTASLTPRVVEARREGASVAGRGAGSGAAHRRFRRDVAGRRRGRAGTARSSGGSAGAGDRGSYRPAAPSRRGPGAGGKGARHRKGRPALPALARSRRREGRAGGQVEGTAALVGTGCAWRPGGPRGGRHEELSARLVREWLQTKCGVGRPRTAGSAPPSRDQPSRQGPPPGAPRSRRDARDRLRQGRRHIRRGARRPRESSIGTSRPASHGSTISSGRGDWRCSKPP